MPAALSSASAVAAANAARAARTVDTASFAILTVLAFLLLNPFLALFVIALVGAFRPVPVVAFVLGATISFTFFFYFRDYGVEWYPQTSTDDVPVYVRLYESTSGLSFQDIVNNFVAAPNGYELLWYLPWWALRNGLDASSETFVFLHYLLLFTILFVALAALSPRYAAGLALVYLLLTPISLDSLAHIWRQQLASSIFLLGLALHLVRGVRIGRWVIFLTPLVHFSFVFFVALFLAFEVGRRYGVFAHRVGFMICLMLLLLAVPIVARAAVFFLDSLGLARIMVYFEGYETDIIRRYILIGIYAGPMLAAYYLYRNDNANCLILVLCFAVFSIALAIPGANSIYERLLMSVMPLWGLFFFRLVRANFSPAWVIPMLFFVFSSGVFRLRLLAREDQGVAAFLAFGNAFDPWMGTVKMLVGL